MRAVRRLLVGIAILALGVSSALAVPSKGPRGGKETSGASVTQPGGASTAAAPGGKAYGYYCRGESKKHVKGEKGTPFSRCVRAMAQLGTGKVDTPAKACKGMSKKHVKGEKGTPFSRCVAAAAKLLADIEDSTSTEAGSTSGETTPPPTS